MNPSATSGPTAERPRVGIPWRTKEEQQSQKREKLEFYFRAVEKAGAEAREICLDQTPEELQKQLEGLDGFVLPGSPADVAPDRYKASKHQKTNKIDKDRDETDLNILQHALKTHKPVLAVCYGCQILNVHKGGSLIQDIPSERAGRRNPKPHGHTDLGVGAQKGDQWHNASFVAGSRLATLADTTLGRINSSHHQAIDQPGDGLRVTALSEDDIIEGVELQSPQDWVVGVQWHPERMVGDAFSERLFGDFVAAARSTHGSVIQKA